MAETDTTSYGKAVNALKAAVAAYKKSSTTVHLMAIYDAQANVRTAAGSVETRSLKDGQLDASSVAKVVDTLKKPEVVPGSHLLLAQALMRQITLLMKRPEFTSSLDRTPFTSPSDKTSSSSDTDKLKQAYAAAESYVRDAQTSMQKDDKKFQKEWLAKTGVAPPPEKFNSGTGPLTNPKPAAATKSAHGSPVVEKSFTKGIGPAEVGLDIAALPSYTPLVVQNEYRTSGLDAAPGSGAPTVGDPKSAASDSVKNAQLVIRAGPNTGVLQTGYWADKSSMDQAVHAGQLIFTGYEPHRTTYQDLDNPSKKVNVVTSRTPVYQNQAALLYALGEPGFPTVAEFQKQMGLPVTDRFNKSTLDEWQTVLYIASANTRSKTTIQQAMQLLLSEKEQLRRMAGGGGAVGPDYSVDPTASAAVLGASMKQVTGRLSTPAEDAEFHKAFNSAVISSKGKIDAQQFARDWVRGKYSTEAGTMAGQDYYGAMYDVLTSGPGSLGSQAADVNG